MYWEGSGKISKLKKKQFSTRVTTSTTNNVNGYVVSIVLHFVGQVTYTKWWKTSMTFKIQFVRCQNNWGF